MSAASRTRAWAFIVYPDDSVFPDWMERLKAQHVDTIISPVHSPDGTRTIDEQGTLVHLKRHHHVLMLFDGVKSQDQVENIISCVGASVTLPFPVHSITGYVKYMVHLGYPEKEQFEDPQNQLIYYGDAGKKVHEAFEIGEFDAVQIISEINQFIIDNGISEFSELYQYAVVDSPKWAYVLDKYNCRSVHALLSSQRWGRSHVPTNS